MKNKLIQLSILCATALSTGVACAEGESFNIQSRTIYDSQRDLVLVSSSTKESIKKLADYFEDNGVCLESPVEFYADHPVLATRQYGKSGTGQCCVRHVFDTIANGVHNHLAGKVLAHCYPPNSGSPTRNPQDYYPITNIDYDGTDTLVVFEGDIGKTSGNSRIVDIGGTANLSAEIVGSSNELVGFE
jgi:hypothetical protein